MTTWKYILIRNLQLSTSKSSYHLSERERERERQTDRRQCMGEREPVYVTLCKTILNINLFMKIN